PVPARRLMGFIPDEPHLYEKLTGREFLMLAGRLHGLDPATCAREVDRWAERLDLSVYFNELAEGYSHGMRQRVVFASALLHRPKVLIVDEPTVGLDPVNTRRAKDIFREFAKGGGAVLLSTHAMDLAAEVGDEVAVIHHGRLMKKGSLSELRRSDQLEEVFLELTREQP
ncbi:MAG: ABC transporter ATP-binding protein, partial [Planctomycetota bacterium]